MSRPCSCGSGLTRREAKDARGIFLTFVCDACQRSKLAGFRSEVLRDPNYAADDLGDDEELG